MPNLFPVFLRNTLVDFDYKPAKDQEENDVYHAVLKLKENPAVDYRGVEEIMNVELTTAGQEVHERILRG